MLKILKSLKKTEPKNKEALEQLVKDNFCKSKGIVGCSYYHQSWCPKTCGFYENAKRKAKYWTH